MLEGNALTKLLSLHEAINSFVHAFTARDALWIKEVNGNDLYFVFSVT